MILAKSSLVLSVKVLLTQWLTSQCVQFYYFYSDIKKKKKSQIAKGMPLGTKLTQVQGLEKPDK